MKKNENRINGVDALDESLLSAMEEFEQMYGEETAFIMEEDEKEAVSVAEEEKKQTAFDMESEVGMSKEPVTNQEPSENLNSFTEEGRDTGITSFQTVVKSDRTDRRERRDRYSARKKKKQYLTVAVCVVLCVCVGVTAFVKRKSIKGFFTSKEETTETVAKAVTTEEVTTATTEDENKEWFADVPKCVPEMTENTISLPSADLSVFTTAMQQEADEVPAEDRIDPWAEVTLSLESVEGSINLTSPGVPEETQQLTSTYMVLVNADTNEIIAERDCEKVVPPASMTKVLTVLTARDYIDEDSLDEKFTITPEMINEAQASGLSAVGFLAGDEVTVRDLLYGTIVCSGADAAMGLAEYCAGSQEAFVEKMNENVEKLGLSDTAHFTNVVGKYDENLNCTMTDMATILSVAMQDDLLRDVLGTRIYHTDIKYPDLDMPDGLEISNWFIRRIEDKEMNGKVLGAKTGFVNQSGFCCASYYEANDGTHYICVTGNANSTWRAIYDHVSVYRSFTK